MDDPLPVPGELLGNLKQLIELDRGFGIADVPKLDPSQAAQTMNSPASQTASSDTPTPTIPPTPAAITLPTDGTPQERIAAIAERIADCQRCGLCTQRTKTVPGEGTVDQPPVLFIGEGPGADEDRAGRPFVGAAGELLERMIIAMGLTREQVFIANVVKCRPPGNRNPEPEEITACLPYLEAQVAALNPGVICTLGAVPLRALSGNPRAGITRQRGQPFTWQNHTCIPTFHPAYLLRNPSAKKPCWEDLKLVLSTLKREPPARG